MVYYVSDTYMVRIPSYSINLFGILEENDFEIKKTIEQEDLADSFKEIMLVSNEDLYNMYESKSTYLSKKKLKSVNDSLRNYLVRAASRPTPFGALSGVALGCFGIESNICVDPKIGRTNLEVDSSWLCRIKKTFHENAQFYEELEVKYNDNTYVSGSREKNIHVSNHGISEESNQTTVSIKNSRLISLIKDCTSKWIKVKDLKREISNKYPNVKIEALENVISNLIKNDFLLTELTPKIFLENDLSLLVRVLSKIKNLDKDASNLYKELVQLNREIECYNTTGKFEILELIFNRMNSIDKSKHLVNFTKGLNLTHQTLSNEVKSDICEFVEDIKYIFPYSEEYHDPLKIFKNKYIEQFGFGSVTKLTDILDVNKFDGLRLIDEYYLENRPIKSSREEKIHQIIDNKLLLGINRKEEEVIFRREDFDEIISSDSSESFFDSFDLNVIIREENGNEEYTYYLAPNSGSNRAGAMINRFSKVLETESYNKFIDSIKSNDNQYEIAHNTTLFEIRELHKNSRVQNLYSHQIINHTVLSLSLNNSVSVNNLSLSSLYIKLDEKGEFSITNSIGDREYKVVKNNMLNMYGKTNLTNFLEQLCEKRENPIGRVNSLFENNYVYTPRIRLNKFIISPKTWSLSIDMFSMNSFSSFREELDIFIKDLNIDRYVYLTESDHRLLINIHDQHFDNDLYNEMKKNKKITLTEFEFEDFNGFICHDNHDQKYVSEFTFCLFDDKKPIQEKNRNVSIADYVEYPNNILPFENGWVFFKIYGLKDQEMIFFNSLKKIIGSICDVERVFFIRYGDKKGPHIRLRFKFHDEIDALNKINILNSFFRELRNDGKISEIEIDSYSPELVRYGGKNMIGIVEKYFSIDSFFVIELLNKYDLKKDNEREEAYIIGIVTILMVFYPNRTGLLSALSKHINKDSHRNIFRKKRKGYKELVRKIMNEDYCGAEGLRIILDDRKKQLTDIVKESSYTNLITPFSNIAFSLVHMFSNRLTGNNEFEEIFLSIIRHAIWDIEMEEKYFDK